MIPAKRLNPEKLGLSSVLFLACIFVGLGGFASIARAEQKAVVSQWEVEAHRIGRRPIIRVSLVARIATELGMTGIAVQVEVN